MSCKLKTVETFVVEILSISTFDNKLNVGLRSRRNSLRLVEPTLWEQVGEYIRKYKSVLITRG
jgi:hypothetical protein